jgi:hypothetical protein
MESLMFRVLMVRSLLGTVGLAVSAAAPAQTTVQQDFDAADAALQKRDFMKARELFTALLERLSPRGGSRAGALVRARLGTALLRTGDAAAAEPHLRSAVQTLGKPEDRGEREVARDELAAALEAQGRLREAAEAYGQVMQAGIYEAGGPLDIALRASLARTLLWQDPEAAARLVDGLLAMPPQTHGKSRDGMALVHTLKGRVELNAGRPEAALKWFRLAATKAGGSETTRVSLTDIQIRGDLAIAYHLLGRDEELQRAVAFSGAGSLVDEGLGTASSTALPPCAPAGWLKPEDFAVIEFGIADDGRVTRAAPVFASGATPDARTAVAEAFTQAVQRWWWTVDRATALDPFWRQAVRVEVRCFTEGPGGNPFLASFEPAKTAWYAERAIRPMPPLPANEAQALPAIQAELARREGGDGLQLIPALDALAANSAAPMADRRAAVARLIDLLEAAKAPRDLIVLARIDQVKYEEGVRPRRQQAERTRAPLGRLLVEAEAAGATDDRGTNLTRLELATMQRILGQPSEARAMLERVVATPESRLAKADPIRVHALLTLADLAAAQGDIGAASEATAATGLTPEQCAIVGVKPLPINRRVSASVFPEAAIRWGTGGFTRVGFDITADGRTTNVRTVIASPPFIFREASEAGISRFRYEPTFRPGSGLGCTGSATNLNFQVR